MRRSRSRSRRQGKRCQPPRRIASGADPGHNRLWQCFFGTVRVELLKQGTGSTTDSVVARPRVQPVVEPVFFQWCVANDEQVNLTGWAVTPLATVCRPYGTEEPVETGLRESPDDTPDL